MTEEILQKVCRKNVLSDVMMMSSFTANGYSYSTDNREEEGKSVISYLLTPNPSPLTL